MLLSPSSLPMPGSVDSSRHPSGSLFTTFLTAPLQAFCLLLGISGSDVEMVRAISSQHCCTCLFACCSIWLIK